MVVRQAGVRHADMLPRRVMHSASYVPAAAAAWRLDAHGACRSIDIDVMVTEMAKKSRADVYAPARYCHAIREFDMRQPFITRRWRTRLRLAAMMRIARALSSSACQERVRQYMAAGAVRRYDDNYCRYVRHAAAYYGYRHFVSLMPRQRPCRCQPRHASRSPRCHC